MHMNHDGHPKHKSMSSHMDAHHKMKFSMGLAFGTLVGTLIGIYAIQSIERIIASGKLPDVEDTMASMKEHTHSMGDALRSSFRTIKKAVGKGSDKIMHEAEDGIEDFKKSL